MTDDIREKAIEAAARAAMKADGCGLTIEGEHVFCDDPRADREIGLDVCLCKRGARAAIDAYERAMWRPEGEAEPEVEYLVQDRMGVVAFAELHPEGEWIETSDMLSRRHIVRFRPLPLPPEDEA